MIKLENVGTVERESFIKYEINILQHKNLSKIKEIINRNRDVIFSVICNTQITENEHLFLRCKGPPKNIYKNKK